MLQAILFMAPPIVSIITRTKNRPLFLSRARESVLSQINAPDWEWIVVNDAGAPEPVDAEMESAIAAFPDRIHVIHRSVSKGMEHASNTGMKKARGRYAVIHDDDDSWFPEFLNTMVKELDKPENARKAGLVCHCVHVVESVRDDQIVTLADAPFNGWLKEINVWRLLQENTFPPISFLFRRSIWEELGGFDTRLPVLGDWEFNIRIALRYPIGVLPVPLARYHHRKNPSDPDQANSITDGDALHRTWERNLRQRWMQDPPASSIPLFGLLSRVAAASLQINRSTEALLSLPNRPALK